MGELQNVFAKIGFNGFQVMVPEALIEIDFLGGHGFRFHDQLRGALAGQVQNEIGDFGGVAAVNHFAAVRGDVGFEFLQVMIEMIDGVRLDAVRLGAQFLIFGEDRRGHGVLAMVDQPRGGFVDGQLEVGILQRFVNLFVESG